MTAVIIEDETASLRNLKAILADVAPSLDIIATLDSVHSSVNWFKKNPPPGLVFMDIHLADGQSFLIFNQVKMESPVIFTTAYDEYALEAFKVNSIDYLLKPIHPEDVQRALAKLQMLTGNSKKEYLSRLNNLAVEQGNLKTLLISHKDKLIPLAIHNVVCFYSKNEIVRAITEDGQRHTIDKALDTLMVKLDQDVFFRANRQFIIAHRAIKEVAVWFGNRLAVILTVPTEEQIIISKARVSAFRKWLAQN